MFAAGRMSVATRGKPADAASQAGTPSNNEVSLGDEARREIGLTLASAKRSRLQGHLAVTATVSADQERSATLRPFGRGRILTVLVRPGDEVRRGEALVTYDDLSLSELRAQMAGAQAMQSQADASALAAREAYVRGRALQGTVLAASEVERRHAALVQANGAVATQRATLLDLRRRMTLFTPDGNQPPGVSAVIAPLDGYVLSVGISPGDMVEAGRAMVTLADLSDMWVLASVFQNDVQRIEPGGAAIITVAGLPGRVFQASVADIGRTLDPRTGAVQVRCVVANPDRNLRIGMLANAQLPTGGGTDAITIPAAAIQQIDGKPTVFISLGDGKFRRQRVEIGLQTPDRVVVRDGLKEGEQVATRGSFALKSQALQSEISGD